MSPTAPRYVSRRTERNPFQPVITEYSNYLKHVGFQESSVNLYIGTARHLLIWLEHTKTSVEALDGGAMRRFVNHDCRCPLPDRRYRRQRAMRSGRYVYWFGRFLEHCGKSSNPSKLEDLLRLLESFLAKLASQGYTSGTRNNIHSGCFHFIVWLNQERITVCEIDETVLERFYRHDRICIAPGVICRPRTSGCRSRQCVSSVRKFVDFLATRGVISKQPATQSNSRDYGLAEFCHWLRQHRGIGEKTIRVHARIVARLLPTLGNEPGRYSAVLIRDVLLQCLENTTRSIARSTAISLRMYLRYLASAGRCRAELIDAVPSVSDWKLSTLPQYISPEEVERTIACCDVATPGGRRNRAILLLMSVLALRAGDIVSLRMTDIDWNRAELRVSGKSRCEATLPLPQAVGDALLDYIVNVRPRVNEERDFLRAVAPYRPFRGASTVGAIARTALASAGVDRSGRNRGAHVFRHSAATGGGDANRSRRCSPRQQLHKVMVNHECGPLSRCAPLSEWVYFLK